MLGYWSPPAALKQNGATFCGSDPTTCKLTRNAAGEYDYAALATHFRDSLDAYASVGFLPDYLSIQNNPDWVPSGGAVNEASRFLATEGKLDVLVNGAKVSVSYPGYREALDAVLGALGDLPTKPLMLAPDLEAATGTDRYVGALQGAPFPRHRTHLSAPTRATTIWTACAPGGATAGRLGCCGLPNRNASQRLRTAVLMHHALVDGGASMYCRPRWLAAFGARHELHRAVDGRRHVRARGPVFRHGPVRALHRFQAGFAPSQHRHGRAAHPARGSRPIMRRCPSSSPTTPRRRWSSRLTWGARTCARPG